MKEHLASQTKVPEGHSENEEPPTDTTTLKTNSLLVAHGSFILCGDAI